MIGLGTPRIFNPLRRPPCIGADRSKESSKRTPMWKLDSVD